MTTDMWVYNAMPFVLMLDKSVMPFVQEASLWDLLRQYFIFS
jgi:hypothetical protein